MNILKSKDGCGKCISALKAYQKQKKEPEEVQDQAQGTEQDKGTEQAQETEQDRDVEEM
jgi:hypothetical protein